MEEEDTIELIDYLRVMWKYKYLILIGVVFCMIVAAGWSLSLPKMYKVTAILEVMYKVTAILEVNPTIGKNLPSVIAASINAGMFNSKIREKIAETSKSSNISHFSLKSSNPKNTNMIKITYVTADIKMGETILEFLNKVIIERYQKEVDEVRDSILSEEEIKKNYEAQMNAISNQIKSIDNTIFKREKDKKKMRIEDLSGLIFFRTSLYNSLLKYRDLLLQTEKRLAKLRLSYEEGGPVKIIQKPTSSSRPVKPKIKLNILLAGVVGLFLFVFLVFFIGYIKNVPKAIRKEG